MIKGIIFDLDETLIDWRATMDRFLLSQHGRFPDLKCVPAEFTRLAAVYLAYGYGYKLRAYSRACEELREGPSLPERLLLDFRQYYGREAVAFDGIPRELERLESSRPFSIWSRSYRHGISGRV